MSNHQMDEQTGEYHEVELPGHLVGELVHQKQPSPHSCLPTAFSIVMGMPVEEVIARIGHDDARGFHAQECLTIALEEGWLFSPHEIHPIIDCVKCPAECDFGKVEKRLNKFGDTATFECQECHGTGTWDLEPRVANFDDLLAGWHGILTGRFKGASGFHAVAWDRKIKKCLDPRGIVFGIELFDPDTFWLGRKEDA